MGWEVFVNVDGSVGFGWWLLDLFVWMGLLND
jgi:hypothetical protein